MTANKLLQKISHDSNKDCSIQIGYFARSKAEFPIMEENEWKLIKKYCKKKPIMTLKAYQNNLLKRKQRDLYFMREKSSTTITGLSSLEANQTQKSQLDPQLNQILQKMTNQEKFQLSIQIMQKNIRSEKEIDLLVEITKWAFQKLIDQYGEEGPLLHRRCCKNIYYEHLREGQILFDQSCLGTSFYIMYKGCAAVLIPDQTKIEMFQKLEKQGVLIDYKDAQKEIAIISEGNYFGEMALLEEKPRYRAATIKSKTECHFIVMSKEHYRNIFGKELVIDYLKKLKYLSQTPWLKHWNQQRLKVLLYQLKTVEYSQKQLVFKECDEGEFRISKSLTLIDRNNPENSKKIEQQLMILSGKELFGYEDILNHKNLRSYNVNCCSPYGKLYELDNQVFIYQFYQLKLLTQDVQQLLTIDDSVKNQLIELKQQKEQILKDVFLNIQENFEKNLAMSSKGISKYKILQKAGTEESGILRMVKIAEQNIQKRVEQGKQEEQENNELEQEKIINEVNVKLQQKIKENQLQPIKIQQQQEGLKDPCIMSPTGTDLALQLKIQQKKMKFNTPICNYKRAQSVPYHKRVNGCTFSLQEFQGEKQQVLKDKLPISQHIQQKQKKIEFFKVSSKDLLKLQVFSDKKEFNDAITGYSKALKKVKNLAPEDKQAVLFLQTSENSEENLKQQRIQDISMIYSVTSQLAEKKYINFGSLCELSSKQIVDKIKSLQKEFSVVEMFNVTNKERFKTELMSKKEAFINTYFKKPSAKMKATLQLTNFQKIQREKTLNHQLFYHDLMQEFKRDKVNYILPYRAQSPTLRKSNYQSRIDNVKRDIKILFQEKV